MTFSNSFLLFALITATTCRADLPLTYQLKDDWLINNKSFTAEIITSADGKDVILQNGLIRRVIRKEFGASISFENLMIKQEILRSIRPEAVLKVDGVDINVGGILGQPNHAFFTQEQLNSFSPDPKAMKCVKMTIGKPQERLAWKRVRSHAPDVVWPPKGVSVCFDYVPSNLSAPGDLTEGRDILLEEPFLTINPDWKQFASKRHERISFQNEGKFGEIYALSDVYCFAEHALPKGVGLAEMTFTASEECGVSWGPGLALLFANGRSVRVAARVGDKHVWAHFEGIGESGSQELKKVPEYADAKGALDLSKSYTLRVRKDQNLYLWDVSNDGKAYKPLYSMPIPADWGDPVSIRVGKFGRGDDAKNDSPHLTEAFGRTKIQKVKVYSTLKKPIPEKPVNTQDAPFTVSVHYELYDGVPLLSKWLTLQNNSTQKIIVNRFALERLAIVEHNNPVETAKGVSIAYPNCIHVETDYSMGGIDPSANSVARFPVRWLTDPSYTSQVNYNLKTPCLLDVSPERGPEQHIAPGKSFESFRAFELLYDSTERQRQGLSVCRMYRTIAPWVTENPLMAHTTRIDEKTLTSTIDQCAAVGFEMLILSFGSGFNEENDSPQHLSHWKKMADYAHSKGIDIGTYSLLASRRVGNGNDIVPPKEDPAIFGNSPSLTSPWGQTYFKKLYTLHQETGFKVFEHDGSYPGDYDTLARPPLQYGLEDSQWAQWAIINEFYHWCRSQGIYLNVPDYYWLNGSSKCGMGYREVNWSLPRAQQVIHTRQNIFDGTWSKLPSMGWMFVPLTQYHGGGAAATIEPLDEHLDHYENMMFCNLAFGVQACYRGWRLYDTDRTKAMVIKNVQWYKKYRQILESELIHLRRADGRDWDGMLHVNPNLKDRALLSVFNPTDKPITRTIRVPLYYAGLTEKCKVAIEDNNPKTLKLDSNGTATLTLEIPANKYTWAVFR